MAIPVRQFGRAASDPDWNELSFRDDQSGAARNPIVTGLESLHVDFETGMLALD
jgi:hypothetical protein